jgi:Rps23 Pro-64 3,4-dihydroxylase Tpa1-like proline 4-hydroxylase
MQEHLQSKIDTVIKQLNLIKQISDSEFWTTTEELCILLKLDINTLNNLKTQELLFRFAWRNFICILVDHQGNYKLWQIIDQSKIETFSQKNVGKFEKASPSTSLDIDNLYTNLVTTSSVNQLKREQRFTTTIPQAPSEIFPSHFVQLENFLSTKELEVLLQFVIQKENDFLPTSNSDNDTDYRRSTFLPIFAPFSDLVMEQVKMILPQLMSHLQISPFQLDYIEAQLTAHNDGNYYKIHNDNGNPDLINRELTYVYYFNREPKAFSGGELVIYDSKVENNFYVAAESFKIVQPINNSIAFFLSRYMHEVLPVSCPSQAFADSRFTINGWVRKS